MGHDNARAGDGLTLAATTPLREGAYGTTRWRIDRWDAEQTHWAMARTGGFQPHAADFDALRIAPYETTELVGNLITNAGWTRLMSLLTATGTTQALDATHTRIGVGSGTTPAEAYTDTDLIGGSKWFQPVSGAGTLGTRTLSFSATFGTSDGNFAWNEFGLDVTSSTATASATVGALLFNHKVGIAQGTKASGQTWTATASLSWT